MDPNDPALEFYRGEGVERFLKRYPVDDEEKRIIYRAIRMAKREKVDEEAIRLADETVARIRREREPMTDLAVSVMKENREASHTATSLAKAPPPFRTRWLISGILFIAIIFILSLRSVESEGERIYGVSGTDSEETLSLKLASGREEGGEEKRREKSLREDSPKVVYPRDLAVNAGKSPMGGEDPNHGKRSELPLSVTDVSDQSIHKVVRVPIKFVSGTQSGKYIFCQWNQGEYLYRYTPTPEKKFLTKSECKKAPSMLREIDYRVASPSIEREMKLLGNVEVSKKQLRCSFGLYADRYDRYRIGLIPLGSAEACGVLLPQNGTDQ